MEIPVSAILLSRLPKVEDKADPQRGRCRVDGKSKLNPVVDRTSPGPNSVGALCSEEKLAILQRFDSNCLDGRRNRLQDAV
jgi:hypothetical protein